MGIRKEKKIVVDALQYFNIFAIDNKRVLRQAELCNIIFIFPLMVYALSLSFTRSCDEFPIRKSDLYTTGMWLWIIFWLVKFGLSYRDKIPLALAVLFLCTFPGWCFYFISKAFASHDAARGCSDAFQPLAILILILPLITAFKVGVCLRRFSFPDIEVKYGATTRKAAEPDVMESIAEL